MTQFARAALTQQNGSRVALPSQQGAFQLALQALREKRSSISADANRARLHGATDVVAQRAAALTEQLDGAIEFFQARLRHGETVQAAHTPQD